MNLRDVLKALFLMPQPRARARMKCVTHGDIFEEPMDASFHETMNLNCRWEKLDK